MSKYVDHSASAKRALLLQKAPLVTQMAEVVRDKVVGVMERSEPTGETRRGHRASAPGQAPAIKSREYLESWKSTEAEVGRDRVSARAYTDLRTDDKRRDVQGIVLEFGTGRMAPRPHARPAMGIAAPILNEMARKASS